VSGGRAALRKMRGVVPVLSKEDWLEVYIEMQKAAILTLQKKGVSVRMIPFSPAELCSLEKSRKVDLLQKADYVVFIREGRERF
jgi:hypothetical protein